MTNADWNRLLPSLIHSSQMNSLDKRSNCWKMKSTDRKVFWLKKVRITLIQILSVVEFSNQSCFRCNVGNINRRPSSSHGQWKNRRFYVSERQVFRYQSMSFFLNVQYLSIRNQQSTSISQWSHSISVSDRSHCGRPLGIRRLNVSSLLVVDAYLGIISVDFPNKSQSAIPAQALQLAHFTLCLMNFLLQKYRRSFPLPLRSIVSLLFTTFTMWL